ncbi:MAG: hypothetical protein QG614_650 [Patescibacteria group bacterium]|nr:hypothetical protein [Patescibacteria group bacterium]
MKKTVNVKVEKGNNEPIAFVLRKFQKRVQESMILPTVRSKKYNTRGLSDLKVKKGKLKRLAAGVEYARLKRLGVQIERKKKR